MSTKATMKRFSRRDARIAIRSNVIDMVSPREG